MSFRTLFAGLLLLLVQGGGSRPEARSSVPQDPGDALASARATLAPPLTSPEGRELASLYEQSRNPLLWLSAEGRLTPWARAGLELLGHATVEGLDPADYGVAELLNLSATLDGPAVVSATVAARFDVLMTTGVLRYFRHLHIGRVDPRTLGLQIDVPIDTHDFATLLRTAIDENRVAETAAELAPPLFQYAALKSALARYRVLASEQRDVPRFTGTIHVGDPFPDLQPLRRLLVATGDLPGATALPASAVYDEATSAGVERFQQRHGLAADGVIGRSTEQALGVPFTWRVRQIELALERLRWLPDLSAGRLVAVNIPMFRLWAWDRVPSGAPPALSMAVVVGRALNTRTPVFADRMEYVIFRPYWNVPPSILRNEIIPSIRKNAGYLAAEGMEIVRGQADDSPVLPATLENIAELGQGGVRVRQRPGPKNALGLVKFMFPNLNDVYMHDTPAPQLFQRSRRDFSHGCIRVEDPVALAQWALGLDASWTRDRVVEAMNGAPNHRVDLPEPIQVVIFYTTAVIVPEDEAVYFADDVYGQDSRLDKAL